jgi:Ser/Thr protein kinase RdoA (MazF antagonist)
VNDAALRAIAAAYALQDARILGTRDTRVVQVGSARGAVAVKSFTNDEWPRAQLEAGLLAHLEQPSAGYRVQTLLRTTANAPLLALDDGAVLVTRWEAGHSKDYREIARDEWRALGASLAALHTRLDDYPRPLARLSATIGARDPAAERAAIAAVRARAEAHDPARAALVARYLEDRLRLLARHAEAARAIPDDRENPIHNDYNQYNYLFDGRTPPVILDWEGAIGAPREYEVVRCLNHLPIEAPVVARAFVDGYRAQRPLRPAALRWAVAAALTEHAVKHWPLHRFLRDEPESGARLDGTMPMVHALVTDDDALLRFFAE